MILFLNLVASIITIFNFVYAVVVFSTSEIISTSLLDIQLTPGVAFIIFFLLEIICSFFICLSIIRIFSYNNEIVDIVTLFFGVINVGTTLFNYKFLFSVEQIRTGFDAFLFAMFVIAGFVVDVVVIRSISRVYNVDFVRRGQRFGPDERARFLSIQGIEYFVMALFIIAVSERI